MVGGTKGPNLRGAPMPTTLDSAPESLEDLLLPILEKLERKEFDLPPLPQVANQVLALTTDPTAQSDKLAVLIQQDIVLTAKILQTANSAGLGSQKKIDSLQQAVTWLGINHVAGAAFTLSVQSGVFNVQGYEREVRELWTQGLATGFYGKSIAAQIGQDQDMAFLCGLLHAIGKPFVVHTVNHHRQGTAELLPWSAMVQLMQESYIEVGRQLGEAWDFPVPVKEAINLHEDHAYHLATSPTKGAVITCLARHLALHFYDQEGIPEETIRALPVVQALTLSDEQMTTLLESRDTIQAQVENMLL